nr:hypothetical protein [Tanacetum cinerariifolium]
DSIRGGAASSTYLCTGDSISLVVVVIVVIVVVVGIVDEDGVEISVEAAGATTSTSRSFEIKEVEFLEVDTNGGDLLSSTIIIDDGGVSSLLRVVAHKKSGAFKKISIVLAASTRV